MVVCALPTSISMRSGSGNVAPLLMWFFSIRTALLASVTMDQQLQLFICLVYVPASAEVSQFLRSIVAGARPV